MQRIRFLILITIIAQGVAPLAALPQEPNEEIPRPLALADVLEIVITRSPALEAARWELRAAEGRALQAGLLLNPELEVEVENFAGSGAAKGMDSAETTVALGQTIELGGKLTGRRQVAESERQTARWQAKQQRLEVIAEATQLFVAGLAAQGRQRLAEEAAEIARATEIAVKRRAKVGRSPPAEALRAKVARAKTEVDASRAAREVTVSYGELAATWGGTAAEISKLVGALEDLPNPYPQSALAGAVDASPTLRGQRSEVTRAEAALELARAQAIPDPTLSVGYRRINDTDDHAVVAGLSLPLPIFNRNQGGTADARATLEHARADLMAQKSRLLAKARALGARLEAARAEASVLRGEILPTAEAALRETERGYERGLFSLLNVLSAQRTLFELREDFLVTSAQCHELRAELDRLLGTTQEPMP